MGSSWELTEAAAAQLLAPGTCQRMLLSGRVPAVHGCGPGRGQECGLALRSWGWHRAGAQPEDLGAE